MRIEIGEPGMYVIETTLYLCMKYFHLMKPCSTTLMHEGIGTATSYYLGLQYYKNYNEYNYAQNNNLY